MPSTSFASYDTVQKDVRLAVCVQVSLKKYRVEFMVYVSAGVTYVSVAWMVGGTAASTVTSISTHSAALQRPAQPQRVLLER